ncbi:MAG TPA: excinuclease ABC subunit UvrC [Candidatus Acidoferrales bacterium]|nr:excinuclease ABC subunit UvrC [Candidatus Acidoferrales bacterium]
MASLEEKLNSLPAACGVYLMRNQAGKVIYVGKAKDLRARVRAYLRGGDGRPQIEFLMRGVADFETLVTQNEKEALILENNLIKQYKPRYNIRLKDDKSYLSIKVTKRHPWPRILPTRKIVKDGSRYFGPYSSAASARETLDVIEKYFMLRTCTDYNFKNRSRPCLQYQIKRCLGPCVLPVDPAEYQKNLKQAMLFIEGKNQELLRDLRRAMEEKAAKLDFEAAARIRDQIQAVEKTIEKQRMLAHWGADQDVFGCHREGGLIELEVLFIRQGKLTGNQAYSFPDLEFTDADVFESFLTQFYQGERFVPEEILLPVEIEDREAREEYLSERKGAKVTILCPQRGDKRRLVEMAIENAAQSFRERHDQAEHKENTLRELQERLRLKNLPRRVECFDISNIHGTSAVGSMVSFWEGRPDKKRYRRYRIRTVDASRGGDDFAMMFEVLKRRFRRALAEGDAPDLVVIDGGRGQLGMALAAMHELGVEGVDVIGLAKMRVERAMRSAEIRRSEERVFIPGQSNPIVLRRDSAALHLLQRVRDEAHRFAISYHRLLRNRQTLKSALDHVTGIGAARKRALLRAFGSLQRLRDATLEELLQVPSIDEKIARRILAALRGPDEEKAPAAEELSPKHLP